MGVASTAFMPNNSSDEMLLPSVMYFITVLGFVFMFLLK